jgi:hypothetical protein
MDRMSSYLEQRLIPYRTTRFSFYAVQESAANEDLDAANNHRYVGSNVARHRSSHKV